MQLVHGRKRELAVADVFGLLEKFKEYKWLHVIDLDAAMGKTPNAKLVKQLCLSARSSYGMKVRVGGGVRTVEQALRTANWGAEQIIIGSAAFRQGKPDFVFLKSLTRKLDRSRIVIALDTAKGHIMTQGWRRALKLHASEVMPELEPFCSAFLCTDVDREGTLTGANLRWFQQLRKATSHPIIAAGGIKTQREIVTLEKIGMDAAVGMAMYKNILR